MKKCLFVLASFLLLSSCQNNQTSNSLSNTDSSSSSEEIKNETVEDILNKIEDNYSVVYTSASGKYHIYKTKNYFYDEEIGGGQFVLDDDTMYIYTVHNNVIVPRNKYSATRTDFENFFPKFEVNMDKFEIIDDMYVTSDAQTMTSLCKLINMSSYNRAELFMDDNFLNFRFYDNYNRMLVSGKFYGVGETNYNILDEYLNQKIAPETETYTNSPLIDVLGDLNNNMTFVGQSVTSHEGLSLLLTDKYLATFSGNGKQISDGDGYLQLNDNLHQFTLKDNKLDVDYEYLDTDETLDMKSFTLQRHDFTKFKEIDTNTYISSDYYNVKNLTDFLLLDAQNVNLVKIKVDTTSKEAEITFLQDQVELYTGRIFNINSSSLPQLDEYLENKSEPALKYYENSELMAAVANLNDNFTYIRDDLTPQDNNEEGIEFYGVRSTVNGRKEYKSYYNNFPSTDYITYNQKAYHYVLNGDSIILKNNGSISKNKYEEYFSFSKINFHYFEPLGNNKYFTSSTRILRQLSKLISSNPYNLGRCYISIENGTINIEMQDQYLNTNSIGHLEKINETSLPMVDNYKTNNQDENNLFPKYNNSKIKDVVKQINDGNNFTVAYQDDIEYGIEFTADDYDYYTNETIYYGMYKDGFITGSLSKYIYNFGWVTDEETEVREFTLSDHPSLYLSSMAEMNPFQSLSDDMIDRFVPYQNNKFLSLDEDICSVFSLALQMGGVVDVVGVMLSFNNKNELVIEVIDEIEVTYDENNIRNEEYIVFATAIITDVGTTKIPSNALIPTMK